MVKVQSIYALGLVAVVGCATPAIAQEYILRIEGGPAQVDVSGGAVTITLDVIGDIFDPIDSDYMLWGSFALETSGSAMVESITWHHADWSEHNEDGGYSGDGNYAQVMFGQFSGDDWIPREGSEIGGRIGSFQITLAGGTQLGDFSANLIHGERYSLSTINVDTGASYYSTPDTLELQGFTTDIVPAPGAMGVFLGAGLLCGRRKR